MLADASPVGRGVIVALAAALAFAGCAGGDSSSWLPDWVPNKLAGLAILPADGAETRLTADDAISTVRRWLLSRLVAIPEEEPVAVRTRITGTVVRGAPIREGDVFPRVENKLAWLVTWRGVHENEFDPPFHTPLGDEPIDFVVFVDGQTGEILYNVFLSGPNRLS